MRRPICDHCDKHLWRDECGLSYCDQPQSPRSQLLSAVLFAGMFLVLACAVGWWKSLS